MTTNLALEYIPRRMQELGIGCDYYLRFRHFVLQAGEVVKVEASNQFYILIEEVPDVSVVSDFGIFDLSQSNASEMLYEHQGQMTITNYLTTINHLRFIQVIPKHNRDDNGN
jgi:hypothetical protein